MREYHYKWQWDLKSSPEALWPWVSNTNRFNRDSGLPPMQLLSTKNGVKRVRFKMPLMRVEWDEEPFEWTYPYHFGVLRRYVKGPLKEMRVDCRLDPLTPSGTRLTYQVWAQAANIFGTMIIPFGVGTVNGKQSGTIFRKYDGIASTNSAIAILNKKGYLSAGGRARFKILTERMIQQNADETILRRLGEFVDNADDLSVQRLRPFALADAWGFQRKQVLETFLRATRAGMLDMYWDLLCPSCRGVTDDFKSLIELNTTSHCSSCNIDFTANFDHNIEVIFRINSSIRSVDAAVEFCVGSPQRQPRIVFNLIVPTGEELPVDTVLEEGKYALAASDVRGSQAMVAAKNGPQIIDLVAHDLGWQYESVNIGLAPRFNLINKTPQHQTFNMVRTSWSDQAATAADVTILQVFRDLFSSEVLRIGEEVNVGSVTLMFTDLRASTKLYREIGDASAFGRVRDHFEVLQRAIALEGGSIVKTMGDAVMAAFNRPSSALRALTVAHSQISQPLSLKIGLHHGPCIIVNLNDRLDYFGSTVNIAARLPNFSNGSEVIFSEAIRNDPDAQMFLSEKATINSLTRFQADLKGFDEPFALWRMDLRKMK